MDLWISLFAIWAVVELVQWARRKPLRARMKAGAWTGSIFASLAAYGQASQTANFLTLVVLIAMFGAVALSVYWARVWLANRMFKKQA